MRPREWSRRDVLRLALATGLANGAAALTGTRLAHAALPGRRVPRYVVNIFLRGGLDAILTTDPKRPADVAAGVDVPYASSAILEAGPLRLGPHLAPLAAFARDMAIVNGVQVHTANHDTGAQQALRLRTSVSQRMPTILDIVALHRDGQPLGCVSLGDVSPRDHTPGWFAEMTGGARASLAASRGRGLFSTLESTEPADLALMARVMRSHAQELTRQSGGRPGELATCAANLEEGAALFDRLPHVPPFRTEEWSTDPTQQRHAANLQRLLWLLEHDLTGSVYMRAYEHWDSHTRNEQLQTEASSRFIPMFARLLFEAKKRPSRLGGSIFDSTLIVMGSELGRFPRLNGDGGKDHLPQAPYIFFGPYVAAGAGHTFGSSGREMEALPLNLESGKPERGGVTLELDDIGTTLLEAAGIAPRAYGYNGRVLPFLLG